MGFGLFVPEFRSDLGMSTAAVGLVSSLGFLGFLLGLVVAQALTTRFGPGRPVLFGMATATLGMLLVSIAASMSVLTLGILLAASSAGLSWTPFNQAIHDNVSEAQRASALSTISTGTAVGIALAGGAALAMAIGSLSWRVAWLVFAAASTLAFLANWVAFRNTYRNRQRGSQLGWRAVLQPSALPLLTVAFVFGTGSAVYIAFAADHAVAAGGLPGVAVEATPPLLFIFYGVCGLAGLCAGWTRDIIGLPMLLRLLMIASAASLMLIAIAPASWGGLSLSAGLQGLHVMVTSAVLAFWSERLFPEAPTLGFTSALFAAAIGNISGPAIAGLVSGAFGAELMFFAAAALPALTAVLLRESHAKEKPA